MRTAILRHGVSLIVVLLTGLAMVVGSVAIRAGAADHLDAPSLGSLSTGSLKGDRDINDVYVFPTAGNRTVLAMTTNPAVNVPSIDPFGTYASNVRYRINIDNNGDFVEDVSFVTTFSRPFGNDQRQSYVVRRYLGSNEGDGSEEGIGLNEPNGNNGASGSDHGTVVASGVTDQQATGVSGAMAFAGERSDPFFFDLIGFRGTLGLDTMTNQRLCSVAPDPDPDNTGTDFFMPLNTLAIVIEVPDSWLGTHIGVWADTRQRGESAWTMVDQMGRPAINTVFNSGADKESFNVTPPSQQDDPGKPYRGNVSRVLQALGGYDAGTADGLAAALIPDVITYDTTSIGTNILNGRALRDDVIDAELQIVLHNPAAGDCVGAHGDYLGSFPYLGNPH